MPELPEVETVARQLHRLLRGRTVRRIDVLDPRLVVVGRRRTYGRKIQEVAREGKQVAIRLRSGDPARDDLRLLCHLRMTGRLVWLAPGETPRGTRHLRAVLHFDRGCLVLVDPRRFGTLRVVCGPGDCGTGSSGLDPTSPRFTPSALARLLAGSRQELKPWLLRQDRLVGLGNIYASEILFAARLSPRQPTGGLDAAEVRRLHGAVRRVLRRAIAHRGTTFSDYGDASGRPGGFQRLLAVYDRAGEPCLACGAEVLRLVQQQRSTYFCPACQPYRASGTDVARLKTAARARH